jgi:hypothetical protein
MSAMSIPVSCVGVKTHVFMNDLVVKFQAVDIVEVIELSWSDKAHPKIV